MKQLRARAYFQVDIIHIVLRRSTNHSTGLFRGKRVRVRGLGASLPVLLLFFPAVILELIRIRREPLQNSVTLGIDQILAMRR